MALFTSSESNSEVHKLERRLYELVNTLIFTQRYNFGPTRTPISWPASQAQRPYNAIALFWEPYLGRPSASTTITDSERKSEHLQLS